MDSILIIDPSVSTFAFPPQPIVSVTDHVSLALDPDVEDTVRSSLDHLSDIPSPTSSTPPDSPPLNPPPSPMTSTDCAGDMLPDNLIDNISHQLTRQLAHDVSSLETNNTISGLSLINDALLKLANQHNHPFIFDEFYEGYTAQSPVHQGIDQISAAWIILHHGTLGRAPSSGSRGLSSGSFIRLFDTSLALRNLGFEQPLLYAQLGRPLYRECGYHIFRSTPHLYVTTGEFYPINLNCAISIIAVPDALVASVIQFHMPICVDTLRQRVMSDEYTVYPPLREWEKNPAWKHPEWYKIEQWMRGERPDFPQVWSEFLNKV